MRTPRQYTEDIYGEFSTLVDRAEPGQKILLTLFTQILDGETYTLEGVIAEEIDLCTLSLKNTKLKGVKKIKDKSVRECLITKYKGIKYIPIGGYIKNYEFLSKPYFNAENELKNYVLPDPGCMF